MQKRSVPFGLFTLLALTWSTSSAVGSAFATPDSGVPAVQRVVFVVGGADAEPEQPEATETQPEPAREPGMDTLDVPAQPALVRFGTAGSRWWTIGGGIADDFVEATDFNIHGAYSYFLDTDLEFSAELGMWYFSQPVQDATGVNLTAIFRWHFINTQEWTVYTDIGIGLLVSSDEVPDGGTTFNFTPRAGLGVTKELTDEGVRLQVGLRWAHISNGRIKGNEDNPARDSAMLYVGVIIPF